MRELSFDSEASEMYFMDSDATSTTSSLIDLTGDDEDELGDTMMVHGMPYTFDMLGFHL